MAKRKPDAMLVSAKSGTLHEHLDRYLSFCRQHDPDVPDPKKKSLFPNLAGFCRWLGCGFSSIEKLKIAFPDSFDKLCAVLEDEALNADLSPTLLSSYLKKRLGFEKKSDEDPISTDSGKLQLVFEHNILEDGS